MLDISIIILTKNEEEMIEGCLKNISDAKEIIIIDAMSTDKTIEICQKYTNKIYSIPWQGYTYARNKGLEFATCKWICFFDADERMSKKLKEKIKEIISLPSSAFIYRIVIEEIILGKNVKWGGWKTSVKRLAQKEKVFYNKDQKIHEELLVIGDNQNVGQIKEPIYHLSHRSISRLVQKINKYSELEAEEMMSKKIKINTFILMKVFIKEFYRRFIILRGFRDGIIGLIGSMCLAFYAFLNYAKLWELSHSEIKKIYKNWDETEN
ncbi:MAG: glycosyltransferase family 2 protein [bacterium]